MSALATWWAPARRALGEALGALEQYALPQRCPACGAPADPRRLLCDPCRALVPRLAMPVCAHCLARERDAVGCLRHPHATVWPAWVYDERAALVVHALKYGARPGLAAALADELTRALPAAPRADLVTAVPLHPARVRERGYNQAACLAEALADALGAPWAPGVLARVRATAPQARLSPALRRRNLAGAFAVPHPARIAGRRVIVVDDVVTTGSTLEACMAALERAGARPVAVTLAWAQ